MAKPGQPSTLYSPPRWIFSYDKTRHYVVSCGSVWCLAAQALVIYYAYIEHSFRFDRSPTVFFAIN